MYPVHLPFHGQPARLQPASYNAVSDFLRSDHVPFWNSAPSMSAIFLSDTADHRSYMASCYHEDCDSLARVTPEMLQFLQKTSDVILAVTNDVTKLSCPPVKREAGTVLSQTTGRMLGTNLVRKGLWDSFLETARPIVSCLKCDVTKILVIRANVEPLHEQHQF